MQGKIKKKRKNERNVSKNVPTCLFSNVEKLTTQFKQNIFIVERFQGQKTATSKEIRFVDKPTQTKHRWKSRVLRAFYALKRTKTREARATFARCSGWERYAGY